MENTNETDTFRLIYSIHTSPESGGQGVYTLTTNIIIIDCRLSHFSCMVLSSSKTGIVVSYQ